LYNIYKIICGLFKIINKSIAPIVLVLADSRKTHFFNADRQQLQPTTHNSARVARCPKNNVKLCVFSLPTHQCHPA
jgi:hypothetical protein